MGDPLYLAVDQGSHATRALIFNEEGEAIARGFVPLSGYAPQESYSEQDPQTVVASVHAAIEQALRTLPVSLWECIVSAALATQRSSIVCWDIRTGHPLSPIIGWQDRRAAGLVDRYKAHAFAVHEQTGLVLSAHYGALKMRWCLDNLPTVQNAARGGHLAMGPLASYLAFRLVEPQALIVDPANAGRTLLWDRHTHNWGPNLLRLFDINETYLPVCTPTRYPFGALTVHGLRVPLAVITGDQGAALFSDGVPRTDTVYINMGTGAFIQRPIGRSAIDPGPLLFSTALQDGAETIHVVEGTVNGAGSALRWAEETLPFSDLPRHIERILRAPPPRPIFINTIGGLGSPFWRTDINPTFIDDLTASREAKAAAVIESILFLIRVNLEVLRAQTGPFSAVVITGGLATNDALCQTLANLSGLALRRPAEHQGTARGLAFLAAGGPKYWPQRAAEHTFSPTPDPLLETPYQKWRSLMP